MSVEVVYIPESHCITLRDGTDSVTVPYSDYDNASERLDTDPEFRKLYGVFRTRYLLRRLLERQAAMDGLA